MPRLWYPRRVGKIEDLARTGTFFLLLCWATAFAGPKEICRVTAKALENFQREVEAIGVSQDRLRDGKSKLYEVWPWDGALIIGGQPAEHMQYNFYFQAPLEGKTFEQVAADRLAQGKTAHVADFFGSAVFSRDPAAFSSLTGIRLRKLDPVALPKEYPAANWNEVEGNLYGDPVWSALNTDMRARKIPAFDIIVCRPEGPLKQLAKAYLVDPARPEGRAAFFKENLKFLNQAYTRLSADEGQMFVQLTPQIAESPEFRDWLSRVKRAKIAASLFVNDKSQGYPVPLLRITKSASSLANLPD